MCPVLTAARWGEVRWAEWTEIDRDEGVWTVPARRTKSNRQHRVPLCGRALEILDAARALGDGLSPLVFTGRPGKPIDEKQLRRMLWKHRIAAVPHGFRSSFRDWAAYLGGEREQEVPRADPRSLPAKLKAAAGARWSQGGADREATGPEHVPVR